MYPEYLECLIFCNEDLIGDAQLSEELCNQAKIDCALFGEMTKELSSDIPQQLGSYFFFTRCGHGVGFWDGEHGEDSEYYDAVATSFPEIDVYVGDDGLVY